MYVCFCLLFIACLHKTNCTKWLNPILCPFLILLRIILLKNLWNRILPVQVTGAPCCAIQNDPVESREAGLTGNRKRGQSPRPGQFHASLLWPLFLFPVKQASLFVRCDNRTVPLPAKVDFTSVF